MNIINRCKNEYGAATIVENVIVLPICFAVIMFVIFLGQILYQKALIVSAADRANIYYSNSAADYNYKKLAALKLGEDDTMSASDIDINSINTEAMTKNVDRQPYRYLMQLFGKNKNIRDTEIEKKIEDYINKKQIFFRTKVNVKTNNSGGLYQSVEITVSQKLEIDSMLGNFGIPTLYDYTYTTVCYVTQPTEMIRTADFAIEVARPLINYTSDKLTGVVDSLKNVLDKLNIFNNLK